MVSINIGQILNNKVRVLLHRESEKTDLGFAECGSSTVVEITGITRCWERSATSTVNMEKET